MAAKHIDQILEALGDVKPMKFLLFIPGILSPLGLKTNEGLFLCDLIFWHGNAHNRQDGWFYKTERKMIDETGLTSGQQKAIIKKLVKLNYIQQKRMDLPAKRHFLVNFETILSKLASSRQTIKPVHTKSLNSTVPNHPAFKNSEEKEIRTKSKYKKYETLSVGQILEKHNPYSP